MNPDRASLAIVTGATAGIGHVFADRLAARGHALLLIARDGARLAEVAAGLAAKHGVEVRTLTADLSDEDEIERVARLLEAEPSVGVLVNNAGFGLKGRIHDSSPAPQMQMLRLHMLAPMRLCGAVLPQMVERKRGWIINVASIASFMYGAGNANYSATKAYLRHFTLALDLELQKTGVTVQALCPGFTHTEFHARMRASMRGIPAFMWTNAEWVVDQSIAAAARGRPVVVIPGLINKLVVQLVQSLPHWLRRAATRD